MTAYYWCDGEPSAFFLLLMCRRAYEMSETFYKFVGFVTETVINGRKIFNLK